MALVFFLLIVNIAVVFWVVARECISREGIEFNHVLMFSIGYLFYWMIPIGIGSAHLLEAGPGMTLWYTIFDAISTQNLAIYLTIALFCYLFFWLGSTWGSKASLRKVEKQKLIYRRLFFYPRLLDAFLIVTLGIAAAYAFLLRDQLFRGYGVAALDLGDVKRGSFIAVSLVLLALAFLSSMKRAENRSSQPSFPTLFLNYYFVAYFAVAFLVLSLGGRLYFISSLVMLMIYWSSYFHRISRKSFLIVVLVLMTIAGAVGSIRQSNSLDLTTVLTGLLAESLFTSFTLTHYLQVGVFDVLRAPIFLMSDFLNLIPTALLPSKAELLLDPRDYGFTIFAPLGAQHVFFSLMINFGIIGTLAFLFSLGWFFSYLRCIDRNLLFRLYYVLLTGWLGFTFFRDDFSISLVKSMFQFSILVPTLIVITLQLVSVSLRNLQTPADTLVSENDK